ncbi:MAG: Asp-tRNA(Asn)/Glu-tRNA(Gln) amidotransferase subunit GatC [Phycisphaerae bacterium]
MKTPLDQNAVRRIATLARLELSASTAAQLANQLTEIVSYVDQLSAVDVDNVEPLAHPLARTSVLRDDTPLAPLETEAALQNAPQRQGDCFRVPAVLDPNSGA